ncbi:MAG: VOC family protein [Bacteroidota bacterium]
MPTFTFNHIALSVKDVDESIGFYQRVFQLQEIPNTASTSKTRWLSLGEGKQLHLIPRPDFEIRTNKAVHFALSTADFEGLVAHLEALEIPYEDWKDVPNQVFVRKDGKRQVYFQDPNGYWVEVNDDV